MIPKIIHRTVPRQTTPESLLLSMKQRGAWFMNIYMRPKTAD